MVFDTSLLNNQYFKVRIKGKEDQSRKGLLTSPIPQYSSYSKGSSWSSSTPVDNFTYLLWFQTTTINPTTTTTTTTTAKTSTTTSKTNSNRLKQTWTRHKKIADVDHRDETFNHIISECCKLAQREYMTRHDEMAKMTLGNCARSINLTIRTNGICITQNQS